MAITVEDIQGLKTALELLKVLGVGGLAPQERGTYVNRRRYEGPKRTKAEMLADKDRSILAGFKRKGIEDVILMDRTDKTKAYNVRPYGRPANDEGPATGWISQGRIVKKGERSVLGMFHVSQTEPLPAETVSKKKAN